MQGCDAITAPGASRQAARDIPVPPRVRKCDAGPQGPRRYGVDSRAPGIRQLGELLLLGAGGGRRSGGARRGRRMGGVVGSQGRTSLNIGGNDILYLAAL